MKFSNAQKCALIIGISAGFNGFAFAAECDLIGQEVTKAVSEKPTKVLVIVDEMIAKNESCACEIVKAAINASDADKALVREIVVTAVSAAQGMAATIAECAVAEAPEAASEIKAGLSEAFAGAKSDGGKTVVYDDGYSAKGGKDVVIEEDVEDDFGPEPIVISGVYLIAPSASGSAGFALRDDDGNILDQDDIDDQNRLIEQLRRRADRGRDPKKTTTSAGPPPSPTT